MVGIILFAAAYFVLLSFYIREDIFGRFSRATKLKMTLSTLFCVLGGWGLLSWPADPPEEAVFILCGLVCALIGDYFLRFIQIDARKFVFCRRAGILSRFHVYCAGDRIR